MRCCGEGGIVMVGGWDWSIVGCVDLSVGMVGDIVVRWDYWVGILFVVSLV